MDFGKIKYIAELPERKDESKTLQLTLIGQGDADVLKTLGLTELRRRRLLRLSHEAKIQGGLLSYEDLSILLFTSVATLKRDVNALERKGEHIPLKGRRNGKRNGQKPETGSGVKK